MDQASRAVPTMYVLKTALCLALLLQICDGNIDAKCSEQQDVCSLDCFLRQQCWTPRLPSTFTLQHKLRGHIRMMSTTFLNFMTPSVSITRARPFNLGCCIMPSKVVSCTYFLRHLWTHLAKTLMDF